MIGIVNYGLGNVQAIANIYRQLNIDAVVASKPEELKRADRAILPGVGAFDWAINRLNASGMREAVEELALARQLPILGICVGMQVLADRSEEGTLAGLGWISGEVRKFPAMGDSGKRQLPHMGWNDVRPLESQGLFRGLESEARFYFLHSYYFVPRNPAHTLAVTDYDGLYTSSVRARNVYGVQFHPEKSHQWGVQLLRNFAEI